MPSPARTWAERELAELRAAGLLRTLEPLESPMGAEVTVGGKRLVNFSSNDYLGLAADARLVAAARKGLDAFGVGAGASRLVVGDTQAHQTLEARLAQFERTEAARLFNSGYAANLALVSTLVGPDDAVFSDALNHASLIDGCRLSRARVVVYPHGDVRALERALATTPARRRLVCTDAVFSMDGDIAPLRELADVCQRYEAALLVDEAHGTGVLGERGAGACEVLAVEDAVDVRMGTLGKALGVFGAYAATSRPVADWLLARGRSLVFSTALPAAVCFAATCALDIVVQEPERRRRLWRNIERFASGLSKQGRPARPQSAIFPVVLGTPEAAVAAAQRLREQGLLVKAIRPPTVPEGTSRLRFALSAAHTDAHLEQALDALGCL
ncbi:MAG: 8-amino-7-oxononanoate synthase [Myxococcaceae bacterium]